MNQLLPTKQIVLLLLSICLSATLSAQLYKTVECTAGNLSSLLTAEEKRTINCLVIRGTMDARDFYSIKNEINIYGKINLIDLSDVSIVSYFGNIGNSYGGNFANELPQFASLNSSLEKVVLPNSIISIGGYAFFRCSNLSSIIIPKGVNTIGDCAFKDCSSLMEVNIPSTVVSIGANAFDGCYKLQSITIPSSAISLGEAMFLNCNQLESATILSPITTVGKYFFSDCSKLSKIQLPSSVNYIEYSAFSNCSNLVLVSGISSVTNIGNSSFQNCSKLESIDFLASATSIGYHAFYNCQSLKELHISSAISSIGEAAFRDCSGLNKIYSYSGVPLDLQSSPSVFGGVDLVNCSLIVPAGTKEKFINANQWKDFLKISELSDFEVTPRTLTIGYSAGSTAIMIVKSSGFWKLATDQNWLTFNEDSDSVDQSITITAEANPDVVSRNATIKIINGNTIEKTLLVTQLPKPQLTITSGTIEVSSNSGSSQINITSNTLWVARSNDPWLSIISDSDIGNANFVFTYSENDENVERSALIKFSASGVEDQQLIIKQKANDPYLNVLTNSITIPSVENRTTFLNVNSNVSWIASSDQLWLSLNPKNSIAGSNSLILTADLNLTEQSRKAMVTIVTEQGNIEKIEVTQEACTTMKTVDCTAGNLASLLTTDEKGYITNLTLKGTINANDFRRMLYDMPKLAVIDLTEATILECSIKIGYRTINYPANTIPAQAFYDDAMRRGKLTLISVSLPQNLSAIGASAFMGCTNLNSIQIPHSVSVIGSEAFKSCVGLNDILLPESLLSIESNVFYGTSISNFTIPPSVTTIKYSGFAGCQNLKNVVIPNTVLNIQKYAFSYCALLTTVTLPAGLTKIEEHTFSGCSALESITIPPSVETIEGWAFESCSNLVAINIPETVKSIGYGAFLGCINLSRITLPSTLKAIEGSLFAGCKNLTEISLPSSITTIGSSAFFGCAKLSSLNIPANVSSIGSTAFMNCTSIKSIVLPEAITVIERSLFDGCSNLISVSIPSRLLKIDNFAFNGCGKLTSITLPESLISVEEAAFDKCTKIDTIFSGLVAPMKQDYYNNFLYDINKNACLVYVPFGSKWAYQSATVWKDFNKYIETEGFFVSIDSLTMGATEGSKSSIPIAANMDWSVSSDQAWLTLNRINGTGNDTLLISTKANASSTIRMAKITFSAVGQKSKTVIVNQEARNISITLSKESVLVEAVAGSKASIEIACSSTWEAKSDQPWITVDPASKLGNSVLNINVGLNSSIDERKGTINISSAEASTKTITVVQKGYITERNINVLAGQLSTLLTTSEKIIVKSIKLTGSLDARDFKTMRDSMPALENIDIEGTIIVSYSGKYGTDGNLYQTTYGANTVPKHSFNRYNYLEGSQIRSVVLPSNCTSIESFAFNNCIHLSKIEVPASVSFIGMRAFYNCKELTDFTLPSLLTSIGEEAFGGCSQLTDITIPSLVKSLGGDAFSDCSNLQRVQLLGQLTIIPQRAFKRCSKLNSINIPQSVYSIAEEAFSGCENLPSIDIPNSVKTIGLSAFSGCYQLNNIKLPGSVTTIDGGSFSNCRSLTSIEIPSSIRLISHYLFNGCTLLESVTLPNSIIEIGIEAFNGCEKLASITIPSSVKKIGRTSFRNCYNLKEVYALPAIPVDISGLGGVFENVNKNTCILFVAEGSKQLYQNAYEWKDFKNIQEINKLSLSATSLTLGAAEGSRDSIYITSNLTWKAVSDQIWLTVNPSTAIGGKKTVVMKASVNPNPSPRTAIVAISGDGFESQFITVKQVAGDSIFTISETNLSYSNMFEKRKIKITSNYKWTATTNQGWLTVSPILGLSSDSITITAQKNEGALRTGIVTVSTTGFDPKQITVTQAAVDTLKIDLPNFLKLGELAENRTINVTSNLNWKVDSDQKWLTVNPSTGSKNGSFIISATKNIGYSRTAYVTISALGFKSIVISVNQSAAKFILQVSGNALKIPCEEYHYSYFSITSNTNWTASSDQSWLKVSPTTWEGNKSLDIMTEANTSFSQRKATITVAINDTVKQLINVTQEATARKLAVSQNKIILEQTDNSKSSFSILANLPWTITIDQNWLSINTISGDGNQTVTLSASENTDFGSRTAVVTVSAEGVQDQIISVIQLSQPGMPDLIVRRSNTAPKVDGIIDANDPWSTQWIPMSTPCFRNTTSAMNAKFQVMAGEDAFYIAIIVRDTTRYDYTNGLLNSFNKDCSEIFISLDTIPSDFYVLQRAGNWLLRTQREGELLYESNNDATLRTDQKFSLISKTSNKEYVQEIILPYSALTQGMASNWDGKYFRFDIAANDNSTGRYDGRTQQQFWNSGTDEQWRNTKYYGVARILNTDLIISPNTINLPAIQSSRQINVATKQDWTASSNQRWLTVSPLSGKGNGTLTITGEANTSTNTRSAVINVLVAGTSSQTITVTQAASDVTLAVSETNLSFLAADENVTVTVTSNTGWEVVSDQSWLTVDQSLGSSNKGLTISIEKNTSTKERNGVITLTAAGIVSKTIHVKQAGAPIFLSVSTSEVELKNGEENASIEVKSNSKWTVSSNQTWLKVSPETSEGDGLIVLKSEKNQTIEPRTAIVKVLCDGLNEQYINIKQLGQANYIIFSDSTISFTSNGGVKLVDIISDQTWMASSNQNWLKIDKENTIKGNSTITLTATMNNSKNERIANVTIISKSAIKTISISQDPNLKNDTREFQKGDLLLFPNPASTNFCVTELMGIATLQITDINGKVLLEKQIINSELIPVGSLIKGVYYVRIITPNKSFGQRLVKL